MKVELVRLPDPVTLAETVAERWISVLRSIPPLSTVSAALSGGRIANDFFNALHRRFDPCLSGVHYFWGDERCVPPTHAESNYASARTRFLDPCQIPPSQIHRIKGEASPEAAVADAEAELCRIADLNSNGVPVLDWVFLGLGEDGHVASLFPGETPPEHRSPVYRFVRGPKPPPERITLDYQAITQARNVWVLVSGPGKEEALRESLRPPGATPLARIIQNRAGTAVFTDQPEHLEARPRNQE